MAIMPVLFITTDGRVFFITTDGRRPGGGFQTATGVAGGRETLMNKLVELGIETLEHLWSLWAPALPVRLSMCSSGDYSNNVRLVCGERRKPNQEIGYSISFNGCSSQGDLEGACKQQNDWNCRGWFFLFWTCLKPCNAWVFCFAFPLQSVIAVICCCGGFFFGGSIINLTD